ncbi:hypothetical protein ABZ891_13145 [Streptomyces sp. NPDC047023]|uniref:hypothetical protein n=1 Tax=Streptomyces sp. NPDC047023 TaxID=3155139 RepID=UPI003411455E
MSSLTERTLTTSCTRRSWRADPPGSTGADPGRAPRGACGQAGGSILSHGLPEVRSHQGGKEPGSDHPLISDRRNIVVDEAHHRPYGKFNGYARRLRDAPPCAALLAFTGKLLSQADRHTRGVFSCGRRPDAPPRRARHEAAGPRDPHLVAEVLRRLIERKMREVTRHNCVRRTLFSEQP